MQTRRKQKDTRWNAVAIDQRLNRDLDDILNWQHFVHDMQRGMEITHPSVICH